MNPIEHFYKDSTILITGANGFLGTVLVEKLLRCFDVKKIYLLIRSKNNESVDKRMQYFLNAQIFDSLREENPATFDKLTPVEVDYSSHDLNISVEAMDSIHAEVQIVFHVAASVKFDEVLNDAIDINLLGTKKVVKLVLGIEKLKAFVHVSTLYSNCNRKEVDEKIYDHVLGYHQLIPIANVLKNMKDKTAVNKILFQNLPNTYTLTKHFAEKLVYHQAFFIPAGIFRPPIVISNYKDFPGYTDNLNGPSGIVAYTVRGFIHCIYGNPNSRSNLVPVDYCINALITCAWDVYKNYEERTKKCQKMPIYNYIFHENNLSWGKYMSLVSRGFTGSLGNIIWPYTYFIVQSKISFQILNFAFHTVPATAMDFIALIAGKKMIYRKAYRKTEKILIMMSYFGCRQWNFGNENIKRLVEATKSLKFQRGNLDFDMKNINWNEYFHQYIPGIRRYIFKDETVKEKTSKTSMKWITRVHCVIKYIFYSVLGVTTVLKSRKILLKLLVKLMIK